MTDPKRYTWPRQALAENPALLVSGIYFFASSIGLVYSWAFLRTFGINVFLYADISDFFLASLKEPATWLLAIFAIILIAADNATSLHVQRRGPSRYLRWYGSNRYRQVNYLVSLALIATLLLWFATVKERGIRDGEGDVIRVHLTDGSPPRHLVQLGTTTQFIFLYDRVAGRVNIHPNESILKISKPAAGSAKD